MGQNDSPIILLFVIATTELPSEFTHSTTTRITLDEVTPPPPQHSDMITPEDSLSLTTAERPLPQPQQHLILRTNYTTLLTVHTHSVSLYYDFVAAAADNKSYLFSFFAAKKIIHTHAHIRGGKLLPVCDVMRVVTGSRALPFKNGAI